MTIVKTRGTEGLAQMISTFQSISDHALALQGVSQVYTEGCLDRLALDFGRLSLIVAADESNDSIDVTVAGTSGRRYPGGMDGSHLEPWNQFIGKRFGWGWVTVNQQGYCDGVLLSFGGIVPQVVLNVMASSIRVSVITAAT